MDTSNNQDTPEPETSVDSPPSTTPDVKLPESGVSPAAVSEEHCDSVTPFQYGIKTLLVLTLILASFFAIARLAGTLWACVIGWLLVLIAAHTFGNKFGTVVYQTDERPRRRRNRNAATDATSDDSDQHTFMQESKALENMRSQANRPFTEITLGRICWGITIVGSILGAALAGVVMWFVPWDEHPVKVFNAFALALVSGAVLGGCFGFFVSSFVGTLRGYFNIGSQTWQADEARKRRAWELGRRP